MSTQTPDVATRIAEALERIAAQLEASGPQTYKVERPDLAPHLFPVRPVTRRRKRDDDEQGR